MADFIQAPAAVGGAAQPSSMFSRLSRASASPDWLAPFAPKHESRAHTVSSTSASLGAPAPVDTLGGLASVDFASPVGVGAAVVSPTTNAARKGFLSMFSRGAATPSTAVGPQPPMALDSLVTIDDMGELNPQSASVNVNVGPFTRSQPACRVDAANTPLAVDSTWGALNGLQNTAAAAPAFKLFTQPKAPRTIDAPLPAAVEPPTALWSEMSAPTLDAFTHRSPQPHTASSDETPRVFSYDHQLHPPQAVTVSPLRAETPVPSPAEAAPLIPTVTHALQPIGEDSPVSRSLTEAPVPVKTTNKLPATVAPASLTAPNPLSQIWSQDWWSSLLTTAATTANSNTTAASVSPAPEFSRSVAPPATVEDRRQRERDAKKEDYLQTVFAPEDPLLPLSAVANRGASKLGDATSAILAEFDEEDRRADDIYRAVTIVLEAVRHANTPSSPAPLF